MAGLSKDEEMPIKGQPGIRGVVDDIIRIYESGCGWWSVQESPKAFRDFVLSEGEARDLEKRLRMLCRYLHNIEGLRRKVEREREEKKEDTVRLKEAFDREEKRRNECEAKVLALMKNKEGDKGSSAVEKEMAKEIEKLGKEKEGWEKERQEMKERIDGFIQSGEMMKKYVRMDVDMRMEAEEKLKKAEKKLKEMERSVKEKEKELERTVREKEKETSEGGTTEVDAGLLIDKLTSMIEVKFQGLRKELLERTETRRPPNVSAEGAASKRGLPDPVQEHGRCWRRRGLRQEPLLGKTMSSGLLSWAERRREGPKSPRPRWPWLLPL